VPLQAGRHPRQAHARPRNLCSQVYVSHTQTSMECYCARRGAGLQRGSGAREELRFSVEPQAEGDNAVSERTGIEHAATLVCGRGVRLGVPGRSAHRLTWSGAGDSRNRMTSRGPSPSSARIREDWGPTANWHRVVGMKPPKLALSLGLI
jgi:hypothetical protein